MRGYATNAADDADLFMPVRGESRVIAGVRCTYDGASYLGAERGWGVCAIERAGLWSVAVTHAQLDVRDSALGHAADLDDAAMEAMRRVAALALLETVHALGTAVAS